MMVARRISRKAALLAVTLMIPSGCPPGPEETVDMTSGPTPGTTSETSSSSSGDETPTPTTTTSESASAATSSATTDPAPVCGDGVVEGPEECDDANDNPHDECLNSCAGAVCGDGVVWDDVESCDDANDRDDDACPTNCEFARCGDGFVQLGVEECDDANDDPNDGCDHDCVRTRAVFVSSDMFLANFGSRFAADQACQALAAAAALERPESFRAWLSDETGSPALDFHHSPGRYALVTGIPVAASWADLTDGVLASPIIVDEHGDLLETGVFTNTSASGTIIAPQYSCENWSLKMGDVWLGNNTQTDAAWTDSDIANPYECGGFAHIYCFEQ